ncbi:MAG: hypothetical protein KKE17_14240 [Proteobacteria bacterium]|nr:hypothetical protein [Pseudomonadota bacterium]MBU1711160.1 hypothetical protein [Pseudomonadota bacterium]
MKTSFTLLKPFLWSSKNRFFPPGQVPYKTIGAAVFSAGLFYFIYLVSLKVITYFHSQSELGIILSLKIFQMAWITFFAMLIFSCMVSAVSTIFLSQDNEIIFSAPVPPSEIFFMRYVTTTIFTSWMMIVFSLPFFAAYGKVFDADFIYWLLMLVSVVSTATTASAFGMLIIILLVNIFPARRTKDIILYLSLCFGIFIYIMFRLMKPENLVNPDQYAQFVDYLSSIATPAGPYVPAAWAANLLSLYLMDRQVDWLLFALLLTTPVSLYIIAEWAMHHWFFPGFSKSQESFGGHRSFAKNLSYRPSLWLQFYRKESKAFLRDTAEWSQLFMIAALVVVYLYNFKSLPVERSFFEEEYVTNLISFLNIGLTGFIITSLSARFVYPSVGLEGGAFYMIRSAPISLTRYLLYKFLFYVIPFTILSLLLVIASDHLLNIEGPMWWFSVITSTIITWTVVAMALGFGAMHADFKAENKAAVLGSMGAILYLFTAMTFQLLVIFFGAMPAYRIVKKWLRGISLQPYDFFILILWILTSITLAFGLSYYFFRKGIKTLENSG